MLNIPQRIGMKTKGLFQYTSSASAKEHLIKIQLRNDLDSVILFHILCWNGLGMPFPPPKMIFSFYTPCRYEARQQIHFSNFSPHVASLSKVFPNSIMFHYLILSLHPQNAEHPANGICAPVCLILCVYMLLHLDKVSFHIHLCIWRLH